MRRYRLVVGRWGWELSGGLVEDGEDPCETRGRKKSALPELGTADGLVEMGCDGVSVEPVDLGCEVPCPGGWPQAVGIASAAVRRELPVPSRDGQVQTEIARRAGLVMDELARLREDLWAEDSSRISERLAAIAQQVAATAATSR